MKNIDKESIDELLTIYLNQNEENNDSLYPDYDNSNDAPVK